MKTTTQDVPMLLKRQRKSVGALAPMLLLLAFLFCASSGAADTAVMEQECKQETDSLNEQVDSTFLKDKIFTQESEASDPFSHVHHQGPPQETVTKAEGGAIASMVQHVVKALSFADKKESDSSTSLLDGMFETARQMSSSSDKTRSYEELFGLFSSAFSQVMDSLHRSLELVWTSDKRFHVFSFWYYLEYEDERKNPSWKRRKHRYYKQVDMETVEELHNGLYLSQLSYADSVDDIRDGLSVFMNNTWELVYCKIEGFPKEPAHFMAIKKEEKVYSGLFPWQKGDNVLDVMIVVRGTKELGDILSDGLLEAQDYRGGKAHAGIAEAGAYLVDKHIGTLEHLLEVSGRDKIRLSLMGHSLGAGAAAIAAIEYNEYPMFDASSIGFGCPALLSLDLSEQTKGFITTVVADSDVVPRMNGATFANMILDVASYDFTAKALEDLEDFLVFLNNKVALIDIPIGKILAWANGEMDRSDRPAFVKVTKERLPRVLYPPGTCIHVFRDGFGYTGSYTPCSYFDSVDVTRTLLDDHLVLPGYHRAFLTMLRDKLKDVHFDFQHDIMALPVT